MQQNIVVRVARHCCWCGVHGIIANRWTRKIRRMVGAYCNRYMTTWVTGRRTFTAYDLFHPKTYYYTYYKYIYINNNNIYSIRVGIIITGMRARMWYYYVCVRSGRKTSFEHNNRQRATVWELRCIRGAVAGLKECARRGVGGRTVASGTAQHGRLLTSDNRYLLLRVCVSIIYLYRHTRHTSADVRWHARGRCGFSLFFFYTPPAPCLAGRGFSIFARFVRRRHHNNNTQETIAVDWKLIVVLHVPRFRFDRCGVV